MEKQHASASEISSDSTTNESESSQDTADRCKELSDDEQRVKDKSDPDLVLDLRAVLPPREPASENDEPTEKLSAVLEQTEYSSRIPGSGKSLQEQENKESNCILQERIEVLREVMRNLQEVLRREVELWRKEKEEVQRLREKDNALALEEATAAARAAAVAYAAESPLSNSLDIASENIFTELTILEYEKRLAKYQDEYSLSQAEKRYNARWKQIATAYKQKLMDVERLCNEELEKVQQNASHLQPLKEMVSQWYAKDGDDHGDTIKNFDIRATDLKHKENDVYNRYGLRKIDAEVNMAPEIFSARFKSDELTMDRFCG